MKALTFNKDSWHYYIASNLGKLNASRSTDICSYTRAFLKGLVGGAAAVAILLTAVGGSLWLVGTTLAFWVAVVLHGKPVLGATNGIELLGTILILGAFIWWMSYLVGQRLIERRRKIAQKHWDAYQSHIAPPPDNFISKAYKAFKEKTCVRVVLVTTNTEPDEDD